MAETETRAILERAAKLVEKGWTQGAMARTASGRIVPFVASNAVNFCAAGAIWRVAPNTTAVLDALLALRGAVGMYSRGRLVSNGIVDWNDAPERTQKDVVTALRAAAQQGDR